MSTVAFDFDYVVPRVQGAYPWANRDDAEEAVQVAAAEMLEKGEPLTTAFVIRKAQSRLSNALRRHERRNWSLDFFRDGGEDGEAPRVELAVEEVDYESHARLREAADDPVLARRLQSVQSGGDDGVRPRGTASSSCRYPDETVAEARRLRGQGATYQRIAELVGAPKWTVEGWVRGTSRRAGTTRGWDRDLVVEAIRRFMVREGRRPTAADLHVDPALPSLRVVQRIFGRRNSWSKALEAAGVPRSEQGQQRHWTDERVEARIRSFVEREGRFPRYRDWNSERELPNQTQLHNHFGTSRAEDVLAVIAQRRGE